MKSKSFSSIEQSKHLIELGLDIKTSDMVHFIYRNLPYEDNPGEISYISTEFQEDWQTCFNEHFEDFGTDDIPAWSVDALFRILPNDCNLHIFLVDSRKVCRIESPTINTNVHEYPIDAIYEMICLLFEKT